MKYLSLFFLVLLNVPGPAARGESKPGRTKVAVFTQFESKRSVQMLASMKHELQSIMAGSRLRFDWRSLDDRDASESFPDLVVVKFKGQCGMDGRAGAHDVTGALAFTHASNGQPLPFIDVDCNKIRTLVGTAAQNSNLGKREYLFGRALGRVLAHEFCHVFAKTMSHGQNGISKPYFTANDLVADKFSFAAGDATSILAFSH